MQVIKGEQPLLLVELPGECRSYVYATGIWFIPDFIWLGYSESLKAESVKGSECVYQWGREGVCERGSGGQERKT